MDKLPNEILQLIVSFLPSPNHGNCDCSQQLIHKFDSPPALLIVRWISRRFRIIANECRSGDILDFFQFSETTKNSRVREKAIKTFLADAHFVTCLSKRTDWKFTSLQIFLGITSLVPSVAHNARTIDLIFYENCGVSFVILGLGYFTQITKLNIDSQESLEEVIDLDLITTSFPALESLKLWHLHEHRGTLRRITRLDIRHHNWDPDRFCDLTLGSVYFPFDSGERLTALALGYFEEVSPDVDLHVLDRFPNLIDLEIFFLVPETFDLIINSNIKLTKFSTDVCWPGFPVVQLLKLFSAPCLSSIKKMALTIEGSIVKKNAYEYLEYLEPVISAITGLRSLQDLYLRTGMRKSWFESFSKLVDLKDLCNDLSVFQYGESIDEITGFLNETSEDFSNWLDICGSVRLDFENAFADFPRKPCVIVR